MDIDVSIYEQSYLGDHPELFNCFVKDSKPKTVCTSINIGKRVCTLGGVIMKDNASGTRGLKVNSM